MRKLNTRKIIILLKNLLFKDIYMVYLYYLIDDKMMSKNEYCEQFFFFNNTCEILP